MAYIPEELHYLRNHPYVAQAYPKKSYLLAFIKQYYIGKSYLFSNDYSPITGSHL